MAVTARETGTFRDAKGQTARVSFFTSFTADADRDSAAAAVWTAIDAMSNAAGVSRQGGAPELMSYNYGTAATYQEAQDKARLTWRTVDNSLIRMEIPAPKSAIFKADQQTVDPSNALVAALVTAITATYTSATVTDRQGSKITALLSGLRVKRRLVRRMTSLLLSSDLGSPAP